MCVCVGGGGDSIISPSQLHKPYDSFDSTLNAFLYLHLFLLQFFFLRPTSLHPLCKLLPFDVQVLLNLFNFNLFLQQQRGLKSVESRFEEFIRRLVEQKQKFEHAGMHCLQPSHIHNYHTKQYKRRVYYNSCITSNHNVAAEDLAVPRC